MHAELRPQGQHLSQGKVQFTEISPGLPEAEQGNICDGRADILGQAGWGYRQDLEATTWKALGVMGSWPHKGATRKSSLVAPLTSHSTPHLPALKLFP